MEDWMSETEKQPYAIFFGKQRKMPCRVEDGEYGDTTVSPQWIECDRVISGWSDIESKWKQVGLVHNLKESVELSIKVDKIVLKMLSNGKFDSFYDI